MHLPRLKPIVVFPAQGSSGPITLAPLRHVACQTIPAIPKGPRWVVSSTVSASDCRHWVDSAGQHLLRRRALWHVLTVKQQQIHQARFKAPPLPNLSSQQATTQPLPTMYSLPHGTMFGTSLVLCNVATIAYFGSPTLAGHDRSGPFPTVMRKPALTGSMLLVALLPRSVIIHGRVQFAHQAGGRFSPPHPV